MSFFSKSKLNVLLIDSDEVIHLVWQNGLLEFQESYSVDDEGYDQFNFFLEEDSKTPFVIVLDVVEEDFRNETVVHVTGADRKAMMERKLAHLYRKTQYRTARVVGREKEGRKDDRILLTGLTKPEVIEPWLARILANQVPLLSVTSAAYVMETFAQRLGFAQVPHLLMVNQEANSGLRQTYLQKGRIIFSRLMPINLSQSEDFSNLISEQCEQTRKYLERIKQLPYEVDLQVHVFTPEKFTDQTSFAVDTFNYEYHVISELPLSDKINLVDSGPGAIAYSIISALLKRGLTNVYAPLKIRRFALLRQIKRAIYATSAMAMTVALIIAGPVMLQASAKWDHENQLAQQTTPLLVQYRQLVERFPETPIPSAQMEMVVGTADKILSQVFRPQEMLAVISDGLLQAPQLIIAKIEWSLEGNQVDVSEQNFDFGEPLTEEQLLQQAIVSGQTHLVTTISGLVAPEGGFREASAQVDTFINSIAQHSHMTVTALNMPVDVRPEINVAAMIDGNGGGGEFVIEVRHEVSHE